jgi:hypothetical protein
MAPIQKGLAQQKATDQSQVRALDPPRPYPFYIGENWGWENFRPRPLVMA